MRKIFICLSVFVVLIMLVALNMNLKSIRFVTASKIEQKSYTEQLNVNGEFRSKENVEMIMSYPLYIKEVFVSEGDTVNKGQAVFSIDKEKMLKILKGEEQIDISRFKNSPNLINYLDKEFDYTFVESLPQTISAPCSGIVKRLNIAPESISMPDTVIFTVDCSNEVQAKFSLSQLDYGKVSVGDRVIISPVGFSDRKYSAFITNDNAIIKKESTFSGNNVVVEVSAHIENPDKIVADGLQINGTVNIGETKYLNAVDYNYIYQDENGQYIMVFNNGYAVKKYIETGIETSQYTQIITELDKDTVLLCGDIKEGDRVIIRFE